MKSKTPLFDLFWQNTKLNAERALQLAQSIAADALRPSLPPRLEYADELIRLPRPADALQRVMEARHSGRNFGAGRLDLKQLGSLFAAFAATSDGRRAWPSGGAKYPIEAYALLLRAEAPLEGRIVYYDADRHSLSSVGRCPSWAELAPALSFSSDPHPAAVVVLVGFPSRNTAKYGERGGRFVLFEAGICMQNLSLRAQQSGLEGVLLGGLHDDRVRAWLGLDDTEALILGGFACGRAPAAKRRFRNPFAPAG